MKGRQVDLPHAAVAVLAHGWDKILADRYNCELELKGHTMRVTQKYDFNCYKRIPIRFLILQGNPFDTSFRDSDPLWGRVVFEDDTARKAARRWLKCAGDDVLQPSLFNDHEHVDFQPNGGLPEVLQSLQETFMVALFYYFNEVRLEEQAKTVVK